MAELSDELLWKWKIWWDPVPPWVFKELDDSIQRQVVAISLEAQAQVLRTQAEAIAKIGAAMTAKR
ncbi:MAG TPA: hypothetical protein VMI94_25725 [Bryobacteraceae bacterium]|nr:hypothetical protein [Bryobacteraceae bacterium]